MSQPKVSVIVPTYERSDVLAQTLAALSSVDYPAELLEIIVSDDGSRDGTAATVKSFPRIRYIHQPNSGVAKARNAGARLATGDILTFVDDDIVVARDNIRRHLAVRDEFGECVVSGHSEFPPSICAALESSPFGRFRLWAERVSKEEYATQWGSKGRIQPDVTATQNLSLGRELFWRVGAFDERFPVGAEDQDLCWRVRAAGYPVVHDYGIRVIHNDGHRDLAALCRREERGAIGIVCLAHKHPDFPAPAGLALNGPIRRADSARIVIRKLARRVLSLKLPLWVGHQLVRGAEKLQPGGSAALTFLYRAMTGLYVFRGTRRGYRITSGDRWRAGDRAADRLQSPSHPLTDA